MEIFFKSRQPAHINCKWAACILKIIFTARPSSATFWKRRSKGIIRTVDVKDQRPKFRFNERLNLPESHYTTNSSDTFKYCGKYVQYTFIKKLNYRISRYFCVFDLDKSCWVCKFKKCARFMNYTTSVTQTTQVSQVIVYWKWNSRHNKCYGSSLS